MDHEPFAITIYPVHEISRERSQLRDTLTYEPEFDPMLYFWPVEKQWAIVQMKSPPHETALKRLGQALLRDGASAVTVVWARTRTPQEREESAREQLVALDFQNFGDLEAHFARTDASPVAPSA